MFGSMLSKHSPVYSEFDDFQIEEMKETILVSNPKPEDKREDIAFTAQGYAANKKTIILFMFLTLAGCFGNFVLASLIIKLSTGYYYFPIFCAIFTFFPSMYPANHIDLEPYTWFHVKWLVVLSGVAFMVSLFVTIFLFEEYSYLMTLKACTNVDFSEYYGQGDYKKSAYTCQAKQIDELRSTSCSCVSGMVTGGDYSNCELFKHEKYACANFITDLPPMMLRGFFLSLYLTITTFFLWFYSTYAYQHPRCIL